MKLCLILLFLLFTKSVIDATYFKMKKKTNYKIERGKFIKSLRSSEYKIGFKIRYSNFNTFASQRLVFEEKINNLSLKMHQI